jgi:death on curing protein
MIEIHDVQNIHDILIERFGGAGGIRDIGLLESAIHRPFATFHDTELYPSPEEKAAAILESILINHPFIDGNKRTAYVLARLILLEYNLQIKATEEEKYAMVIAASKGEIRFAEIKDWIRDHLESKSQR